MNLKQVCLSFLLVLLLILYPLQLIQCKYNPAGEDNSDEVIPEEDQNSPEDFSFTPVPDPLSGDNPLFKLVAMDEPKVGQPFQDHHFKTRLIRTTLRGKIRQEYSRFDPFNSDQSMIYLRDIDEGDFMVYRTSGYPYVQETSLIRTLSNLEECRWDPVDPGVMWGQRDFSIITLNVLSGAETVIKNFARDTTIGPLLSGEKDLYRITMLNEGESSRDKRFWVFVIQGTRDDYRVRYLFTWDRQLDKVPGMYKIPAAESLIDWVGMSTLGNWVLIGGDWDNGGKLAGLTMANRELSRFHRLDYATAHSDVGLDSDGREVIVMQNVRTDYIDLIPLDWNTKPILQAGGSYQGTNRIPLVRLFYNSESPRGLSTAGIHISCNTAGYAVISTHIEPGKQERNWLDRTNILVRLDRDRPGVFYLSKIYSTYQKYWEETHATITSDGSRVIWASNWNKKVGSEQLFLLQLDLPDNWKNLTGENRLGFKDQTVTASKNQ